MSRTPWRLMWKHLRVHWMRSLLTLAAMVLAVVSFCSLISVVTTVNAAVTGAAANRVVVQSAVSLFVNLPRDYQPKIASTAGVEQVTKFQWFGGYFQERKNFFAQFGVDHEQFFDMYARDLEIITGPGGVTGPAARAAVLEAMARDRRACVIGDGLVQRFGWQVGQTVPLRSTLFELVENAEKAWEFTVVGVYRPLKNNVDRQTMWLRYDYVEEFLDSGRATGPLGPSVFMVNLQAGYDPAAVTAAIDAVFANGPQVTKTTTEAAFQAGFVSMIGNLPMFIGTIGGAVVFAILFILVNTMLLAGRQRTHDGGIMKALGFRSGVLARLMLSESVLLALAGGVLGVLLAYALQGWLRVALGNFFPNYSVEPRTAAAGLGIALGVGVIAGLLPAVLQARLRPTEALRSEG